MLTDLDGAAVPIAPGELVAPKIEIVGGTLNLTVQPSVAGRSYQLQHSDALEGGTWLTLGDAVIGDGNNLVMTTPYPPGVSRRFFRLALDGSPVAPDGFALIPAGSFQMGQDGIATPVRTVNVSGFFMAKYETTKELWTEVRAWGRTAGYTDIAPGLSKAVGHPVEWVTWYDVVKWCNARSEKENLTPCYRIGGAIYKTGTNIPDCNWNANGYRLPTEAEWEKAARGGLNGKLFPWGDTISHIQANYYATSTNGYDLSGSVENFHPTYAVGATPYTSPVGSFAPNGYGLYDMAGNMKEWCWDWRDTYDTGDTQTDPRGPASGSTRVVRGGSWGDNAGYSRCAMRHSIFPEGSYGGTGGLRVVRGLP